MSHVIAFTFDEAHTIEEWGSTFRDAYKVVGSIRTIACRHIPIHAASATLSDDMIASLKTHLHLQNEVTVIRRNIDRPNIFLQVHRMQHPSNSFHDLAGYISRDGSKSGKFLVFCASRNEAQDAAQYLRRRLSADCMSRIKWYHSGMTDTFREDEIDALKKGDVDGLCATDAIGMGVDIPDIIHVIVYGVPKIRAKENTTKKSAISLYWQRAGRAVRDKRLKGRAVLIAEPVYFDSWKKDTMSKAAEAERQRAKDQEKEQREVFESIANAEKGHTPSIGRKRKADEIPTTSARKKSRTVDSVDVDVHGYGIRVERPMDDFINAENRGERCRREVILRYFGSVTLASTSDEYCCPRCQPDITPNKCCDICNPDHWPIQTDEQFDKSIKSRKLNPKDVERGERDKWLRSKLVDMRDELKVELGLDRVARLGLQVVWSTELLDCMVDLAHYGKLKTMDDFRKQISWFHSEAYGPKILKLIAEIIPPETATKLKSTKKPKVSVNATSAPPVQGQELSENLKNIHPASITKPLPTSSSANPRRVPRCRRCGNEGHIRSNHSCPQWATSPSRTKKTMVPGENMA
ncbi:hypothetical protein PQX77_009426 [Marasmius sp. AFHP31]|nr:hypothetical protein PQX77_009426 [Marasmius sp. AFHP31]